MIGQKRRQSTTETAVEAVGGPRSLASAAALESASLDGDHGVSVIRYFLRLSWFRKKSSKDKMDGVNHGSSGSSPEQSQSPPSSASQHHINEFFQRQRHRYRRFCKNIIKRSRTVDYERRSGEEDSASDAVATEEDWKRLEESIARLLERLHDQPDQGPAFPDEECVICITGRASMQTFPCGHKVLCKTCFVRTIQVALQERQLPLRCIVCRSRIVRLKQQPAPCRVVLRLQADPPGSYYLPRTVSPSPTSGIRRPGYM